MAKKLVLTQLQEGVSQVQALTTQGLYRPLVQIAFKIKNQFSYLSTKTYVVGTQKNRFNERVLSSTHNKR